MRLLNKIRAWLDAREGDDLAKRYGGAQRCPWCRQWAQKNDNKAWGFRCCEEDAQLDTLTCGVCGGTSLWLWAMGFIYIRPGKPPLPLQSTARFEVPSTPRKDEL